MPTEHDGFKLICPHCGAVAPFRRRPGIDPPAAVSLTTPCAKPSCYVAGDTTLPVYHDAQGREVRS